MNQIITEKEQENLIISKAMKFLNQRSREKQIENAGGKEAYKKEMKRRSLMRFKNGTK